MWEKCGISGRRAHSAAKIGEPEGAAGPGGPGLLWRGRPRYHGSVHC
jgi:hypothetical protein